MRWIVVGLFCLTALLSTIYLTLQQRPEGLAVPETVTIPGLRVASTTVNVGLLAPEEQTRAFFELSNVGHRPLEIVEVIPECGCTSIDLSETRIVPGDSLSLPVRVDARSAGSQTFSKQIEVRFHVGGGRDPKGLLLVVMGKIDQSRRFFALPGVLDFGSVLPGRTVRLPVDFFGSRSVLDALPDEVQCGIDEPAALTIRCGQPVPEAGVKTISFHLMPAESDAGPLRSQVVVTVDGPQPHRMVLPIKAHVRAAVEVRPRRVFLAPSGPDDASFVDLTLDARTDEPLGVSDVSCDLPVEWSVVDSGTPGRVVIRLKQDERASSALPATGLLRIGLDSPHARLVVPVVRIPQASRESEKSENGRAVRRNGDRVVRDAQSSSPKSGGEQLVER